MKWLESHRMIQKFAFSLFPDAKRAWRRYTSAVNDYKILQGEVFHIS